jgi:hypothetical protein
MVDTAGIISTVAGLTAQSEDVPYGYHYGGYSGDGGQATNAQLSVPYDVTLDQTGRIYISDGYNNVVRMEDTDGITSNDAGNGTAGNYSYSGDGGQAINALLNFSKSVSVDQMGMLYIVDNYIIRMIQGKD